MSLKIIFTELFFFKIKNKNTTNVNSLQGLCITGLIVSNYIYIYIPYSRVLIFRFIRDSRQSAKKRIRLNFHPLVHKFFLIFLNNCIRSISRSMTV
jgi:hypothetical protein